MRQNGTHRKARNTAESTATPAPSLLLIKEAAKILRYHPKYLCELIRTKRLGAHKAGRKWLIPESEIESFLGKLNTTNAAN